MTENQDVAKQWHATEGQKSKATRLRIFAAVAWVIAIGSEIAGIVLLYKHKFDHGNLGLLIGLLVVIAVCAITGSFLWKAANRNDPASQADKARFFFQNQLGAIITLIAFVPLVVLIFLDKDMDPKNKKIAGGVGAALAVIATLLGVSYHPPSVEKYTQDMNQCAAAIKAGTTDQNELKKHGCSDAVISQAADVARDTTAVQDATKSAQNPEGLDTVWWIADNGNQHVFHLCKNVSRLEGKDAKSGSVTEAYNERATVITKEITRERRECGFTSSPTPSASMTP